MSSLRNEELALNLIKDLKLKEMEYGTSIVYRMFTFLDILDLGVTQSFLGEQIGTNQSYISASIRLKNLPDEVLIMGHAGAKGSSLSIPLSDEGLKLPRKSDSKPKGITYKKLNRMLSMLPSKHHSTNYQKEFDSWEKFMASYETLQVASSTTDVEFDEWIRCKFLENKEPLSINEIAERLFSNSVKFDQGLDKMLGDLLLSGDTNAVKVVRKLMEEGKLTF
jgi:transcriptional regulator with XRE-family HTH domain